MKAERHRPGESAVLLVGAGGLGHPAAVALAREGGFRLTWMDGDHVDASNLHRQPLFRLRDLGTSKVQAAARTLREAFPSFQVQAIAEHLSEANGPGLFAQHALVVDATDGVETKLLLSELAVRAGRPLIHGGVLQLSGLAFVVRPGGPCLRCLFPDEPSPDDLLTCSQSGVLGSVAGVVGSWLATLALEELRGSREGGDHGSRRGTTERVRHFDAASLRCREAELERDPSCPVCSSSSLREDPVVRGATPHPEHRP